MAAKRRRSQAQKPSGRRGPRGKTGAAGATGPAGPPGHNHTNEIALLSAQMDQVVRELRVQLTRIAQIQAQLDHLALGVPRPSPHRDPTRTDN